MTGFHSILDRINRSRIGPDLKMRIYNLLWTYIGCCLVSMPFPAAITGSLFMLLPRRKLRMGISLPLTGIYLLIDQRDPFMTLFYLAVLLILEIIAEYRLFKEDADAASAGIHNIFIASGCLLLTDFLQKNVWTGFKATFLSGLEMQSIYRVLSLLVILFLIIGVGSLYKNYRTGALISCNVFFIFETVNYFVTCITNKPFSLSDMKLIGTVIGVAENVQIDRGDILYYIAFLLLAAVFNLIIVKTTYCDIDNAGRIKGIAKAAVAYVMMALLLFTCPPLMYNSVNALGLPMHLATGLKGAEKPTYVDDFPFELDEYQPLEEVNSDAPHIIVIMSEAFSDLSRTGEFETNMDYIPYIRQVMEDYPSGILYSSVFGNNTVSSEYEFLSGIPTAFSDKGSNIYLNHLAEDEYSVVELLKDRGYHTTGIHPYKSSGYNRSNAWQSFGFDESIFEDDFTDYNRVRKYISDESFYDRIIEIFEDRGSSKEFIFGISMQNHATYSNGYDGEIRLKDSKYKDAEEYFSVIYETDKATRALIEYFEKVDEDIMIVFFGDHQPMIDGDFYTDILGEDFYTLKGEDQMKVYEVPYFIWTNYDSDYTVPEKASINYLAGIMLDAAGIKKDAWFTYTGDIFEEYPVITDNFILAGDSYMAKDEAIDRLKEIKPSDTDNVLYNLKKYQVYSYIRAIK